MEQTKRDYYDVLGLNKNASESEIKSAFRKLSRKWHPDMQAGKSDAEKKEAEEKFKEIAEAYEVLSDKDKRQSYDSFGFSGAHMSSGSPFEGFNMADFMSKHSSMFGDMFSDFGFDFGFGRRSQRQQKSEFNPNKPDNGIDFQVDMSISFKQSVFGCTKDFDLDLQKECPDCHGTGYDPSSEPKTCEHCHGTGMMTQQQRTPFGVSIIQSVCPYCHGEGHSAKVCSKCYGKKRLPNPQRISVKVPAGISDGQRLRVVGKGQCGCCNGTNGNLYVQVHVKESDLFIRSGNDITIEKFPISILTASLGGKVDIPTLNGYKKMAIPAGIRSGTKFRLQGQGIAGKGDFYVEVIIQPLANLSAADKDVLQKLEAAAKKNDNDNLADITKKAKSFYQ